MDEIGIALPEAELTAADEVRLARQIEAGVIASAIRCREGFADLGVAADEAELIMLERRGAAAARRFVEQNLRLVAMVSRREAQRSRMAEDELFQEGCLGLLEAVRRFDHRRELRFATYALYWIRAHVRSWSASRAGELNLPSDRAGHVRGVRGTQTYLAQQLGRPASISEIAAAVGRSPAWVSRLLDYRAMTRLDHEELTELDLADPVASRDVEAVLEISRPGSELLDSLGPVQRKVIELRFGFADGVQHSYRDTSRLAGISASTVRREEARAIDQLRSACPQQAIVHLEAS